LKKSSVNKVGYFIVWLFPLAAFIISMAFTSKQKQNQATHGLHITIDRTSGDYFIVENDVTETLKNLGFEVEDGNKISQLAIHQMETKINNNPFVQNAEVFTTIDGKVKVKILQRKPILRVFRPNGESFYLDQNGRVMPLSYTYSSRVLVANGDIKFRYSRSYKLTNNQKWNLNKFQQSVYKATEKSLKLSPQELDSLNEQKQMMQLFSLANFINQNPFWNAQINQVFINQNGDFELIPRVGNHRIILGNTQNMDKKFNKLKLFYQKGLNNTGWNEYSIINLKFKNQVVCTKS